MLMLSKMLAIKMAVLGMVIWSCRAARPCRTFCGNITVDYPFGVEAGCGHLEYSELVYCINNVMMLHLPSGSYQVLDIDYAFRLLTLFDPKMSTCSSMHQSQGFVLEDTRSKYLQPTPDNAVLLLGCSNTSSLFQGFPDRHLPCQNVSGMGCDSFYDCPAWVGMGRKSKNKKPPPCCGVPYSSLGTLNLTHLGCYSYAAAYTSAPLRYDNPGDWSYGLQIAFQVPADADFCSLCKASRGVCGYSVEKENQLCLCDGWNSTTTCDAANSSAGAELHNYVQILFALLFAGMLAVSAI